MSISLSGYNGERCDPVSGIMHLGNGYRTYHPGLRRFNRPDSWSPFGRGGMNPYLYCTGDPINRNDPSGHFSWQAGLGIVLGVLGMLGAAFTAGSSLAAAASLSAALAASSVTTLAVGAAGMVADVTGVASALTSHRNPKASALLGWISFASGILSLGAGLAAGGYRILNKTAEESGYVNLVADSEISAAAAPLTLETVSQNPLILTNIMRNLPGTALDSLRATSKTLQSNVESLLTPLERVLPARSTTEFAAYYAPEAPNYIMKFDFINSDYIERIRSIWRGEYPLTSPSQLSQYGINPLNRNLSKLRSVCTRRFLHPCSFIYPGEWESALKSDEFFRRLADVRNQKFKQWQSSFRELHANDFADG